VPLLVSHPVLPVMLTHYELDMLRREAGGVLRSYVFGQGHPLLAKIAAFARGDPDLGIGKPEQFVFERRTEHRDRQSVLHQLTCDIALLMEVIGTIDRVAAMGSRHEEPDFSRMTVQLSGPLGVVGRWGVEPVENVPQRRLSLIGEQGRAVLLIPDDAEHGEWSLEVSHAGEQQVADAQQWSSATHAVNQLEVAIDHGDNGECWSRACQSAELAEAAEQCLARGRTIELHFEEHSPQATFKGQMATWGCVLMLAVLSMMCIAGMLGLRLARVLDFWPAGLLALLLLFLAVQALPKLFPESKPEKLKDE